MLHTARSLRGMVTSPHHLVAEGQPQTQAAVFTRHAHFGQEMQAAVTAPRWVLGRAESPLWHSKGVIEAAGDPRGDGLAVGF